MLPKLPSFRLDGRRALVTGAGRGIGLAAAAALCQSGSHVTLVSRTESELKEACVRLRDDGGQCDYAVVDVVDVRAVDAFVEQVEPFRILVNNAGLNRPKLLVDVQDDDIDAVLDLNVKATFYVTRAVTRRMVSAGTTGSIMTISSQMGHVGSPRRTLYCASKHAVEGMTKALAWELGPKGIRVNSIGPTFIETKLTAPMFEDPAFRGWVTDRIALGRLGQLEEIMGAIVFLASDASSLVTGSALMLDGGWTAA